MTEQQPEDSPPGYQHLRVQPLTPHLGAEIFGADLSTTSPQQQAEIYSAFLEHGVLVFRDQTIDREQHKGFGRQFGALHVHPSVRYLGAKGDPEIFTIRTTPSSAYTNGEGWHSDVSCEDIPPMASILYVREMPGTCGGDTLFADMYQAYEMLYRHIETGSRFQCRVRWAPGTARPAR